VAIDRAAALAMVRENDNTVMDISPLWAVGRYPSGEYDLHCTSHPDAGVLAWTALNGTAYGMCKDFKMKGHGPEPCLKWFNPEVYFTLKDNAERLFSISANSDEMEVIAVDDEEYADMPALVEPEAAE
jgi:hypothetical protein